MADVPATVAETVLVATLIRAAVMTALEAPVQGDEIGRLPPGALRAAYWKAAHDGLSGHTLDLSYGRGSVPARECVCGVDALRASIAKMMISPARSPSFRRKAQAGCSRSFGVAGRACIPARGGSMVFAVTLMLLRHDWVLGASDARVRGQQ